jgi:hypothetical protein
MALCRCKELHNNPIGHKGNQYVLAVEPLGYPTSSSICGINATVKSSRCELPGLIWLNVDEKVRYDNGERIFEYANNTTKVLVK